MLCRAVTWVAGNLSSVTWVAGNLSSVTWVAGNLSSAVRADVGEGVDLAGFVAGEHHGETQAIANDLGRGAREVARQGNDLGEVGKQVSALDLQVDWVGVVARREDAAFGAKRTPGGHLGKQLFDDRFEQDLVGRCRVGHEPDRIGARGPATNRVANPSIIKDFQFVY